MKNFVIVLLILSAFVSCEDVIDLELPREEPRLVVDGLVRVDTTQQYVGVQIKMTLSSGYFEEIPITQVESATIVYGEEDEQGFMENTGISVLEEKVPGSGVYEPLITNTIDYRIPTSSLNPNITLYLYVRYNDRLYAAKTTYVETVPIDNLEQGDDYLFDEDDTEIIITYTDEESRDDFYVLDFDRGNYLVSEDEFYNGQQFQFSYYYEDLNPGDVIEVSILGANREFYNYMNLLIEQTETEFDPFGVAVATIRGNIFDATDIDNDAQFDNTGNTNGFALGYFAVVQEFKKTITIE